MSAPARRRPFVSPLLALVAVIAAVDGRASASSPAGSVDTTMVDRAAVDRSLAAIAEQHLGDSSPTNGAVIEDGSCPVLGDVSVAEVVEASGVDLALTDPRPSAFFYAAGDGLNMTCGLRDDDGHDATISIAQTRALDADEWIGIVAPFAPEGRSYDAAVELDGFGPGSVATITDEAQISLVWVDNSLGVGVSLTDGDRDVAVEELAGVLVAARGAVLEALQGSAEELERPAVPADELERRDIAAAFHTALADADGPGAQRFDDVPCPVLAPDAYEGVASSVGWDPEAAVAVELAARPAMPTVRCSFGEGPGTVSLFVALGRPISPAEHEAYVEGPLSTVDWTVAPLDATNDVLGESRAYTADRGGTTEVGWINNGLRISVTVADSADAVEVLTAVVPAVLDTLDLDR